MSHWTMKIDLTAHSIDALRRICKEIVGRVATAKNYKDFPISGAINPGTNHPSSYRVTYTCPLELRIAEMRKELEEMEAQLAAKIPGENN